MAMHLLYLTRSDAASDTIPLYVPTVHAGVQTPVTYA